MNFVAPDAAFYLHHISRPRRNASSGGLLFASIIEIRCTKATACTTYRSAFLPVGAFERLFAQLARRLRLAPSSIFRAAMGGF